MKLRPMRNSTPILYNNKIVSLMQGLRLELSSFDEIHSSILVSACFCWAFLVALVPSLFFAGVGIVVGVATIHRM